MRFVKRILCLFMIVPCILFTGCNSILYNGNLKVEPYEPATLPVDISHKVEQKVEEVQEQDSDEKYAVEGTDAFYFLPQHENKPDVIVDFKVLDYRSQEGFIYCYKTPYYGSGANGDLGLTASKSGTAPEGRTATQTADTDLLVTVLMSYRPDTRAYNVFFTGLEQWEKGDTVSQDVEGIGELSGSVDENLLMAHKLEKEDQYFLYFGNHAYLFNPQGEEIWSYDYNGIVTQEIQNLVAQHRRDGYTAEVTVSDVVMDGSHYIYIPVSLQLEKEDDGGLDIDSLMENDKELENTSFQVILTCYNMEIGEGNSEGIRFTSENENWEAQRKEWLKDDGEVIGDREDLEAYLNENSMYAIKRRSTDDGGDKFPVFATVGHPINMELACIKEIYDINGRSLVSWLIENASYIRTHLSSSIPPGYYVWEDDFWNLFLGSLWKDNYFWGAMDEAEREQWVSLVKALLILKSQENDVQIPLLAPGKWNGKENPSPLPEDDNKIEGMFASKTTVYEDGSRATRLADIRIPGRFKEKGYWLIPEKKDVPMARFRTTEYTPELKRTLYYEEEETYEDEDGNEQTRTVTRTYTETTPAVPLQYEVYFPEGTTVFWVESRETDAQVSPSGDFGALYLSEVSESDTDDEDFISQALYDDGLSPIPLSDSQVKGKAIDGGIYYYGNSEIAAVITSTGITFYKRSGRTYDIAGKRYISLPELARSGDLVIAVTGEDGYTGQLDSPELEGVDEEQDEIIQEKLKSGSDTEIFAASDLTMLNENEFLISSMYNGIILYNFRNGMSIQLESGSYFGSFSLDGDSFMVVGYQTEEYSYQPSDVAWAKCYEMALGTESRQMESEALYDYVDGLANDYLSRTHRVQSEDGVYTPVQPSQEEKEADEQALRLFFGSDEVSRSELRKIMDQQGFDIDFEAFWEYTKEQRTKLQDQRSGLAELYGLAGLDGQEIPPEDGQLLEIEGRMIRSPYTSNLENLLVELALTDQAVARMSAADQERYRGYQESQRLLKVTGEQMDIWNSPDINGQSSQVSEEAAREAQQAMEDSAYYQAVLKDLESRFEEDGYSQEDEDWEEYLQRLLRQVSPDYSTNTLEEGLEEFCRTAGISQELTDVEELKRQLSSIRQVWELESLIISMKATSASYQNSGYQKEYETFLNTHFSTEAERLKAFQSAGFYRIITDLQIQNREFLEENEMTWEELLEDIIGKCGSGIVLGIENGSQGS